jgi:hypothetical protein
MLPQGAWKGSLMAGVIGSDYRLHQMILSGPANDAGIAAISARHSKGRGPTLKASPRLFFALHKIVAWMRSSVARNIVKRLDELLLRPGVRY